MTLKKINLSFCYRLLPVLFSCALLVLLCACSKQHANAITPVTVTPTNNDTMPSNGDKKYLALGDSYTIGTSISEEGRYPVQTAAILKKEGIRLNLDIIATNGWTTGDLMNAIKDRPVSNDYAAVTVLIGVNNQYRGQSLDQYKQEFTTILQRAIQLAGGKPDHVVVLSIPDYSVTPFAKGRNTAAIAAEIDLFNEANRMIAGNYKVNYLYVTDESRKAAGDLSLVAADNLHFSEKEYAIWAERLAPMIKKAL